MKTKKTLTSLLSIVLCASMCVSLLSSLSGVEAASKTILLEQAQRMALASSSKITKKTNEIILKEMKYVEAVDGLRAKIKNLRSFRWTPLLSFKFPQKLDLVEEFESTVKPLTLQTEIDVLRHELADLRYLVLSDVNKQYTNLYVLQEKIIFTQDKLDTAQTELSRNETRLVTGDAVEADVEKMRSSVDALTTELSNLKSKFESGKAKFSDLIGLDVTSGYTFRNSLKSLSLPRDQLAAVTEYTVANDHNYHILNTARGTALLNLNTYVRLMKNQYGDKINYIQSYINMAKAGQDIDYAAFQMSYKQMIKAVDRPWNFSIKILFWTFTLEWFKGAIDGSRYIEDEMYAAYTACLEYASAEKDRASAEKELRDNVEESYDALVTQYKAYEAALKLADTAGKSLEKIIALNKIGKATFEEVADARANYQDMQLETIDALASYNTMLYDFDRLTCGAITIYLRGESLSSSSGDTGDSFVRLDPITDPYYYIYNSVADMTFSIGVSIPENFTPTVESFEIWIDGTQVGERTPIGRELTHLALDYQESPEITIRLYNGEDYVTECVINAAVPRDVLPIESASEAAQLEPQILGSYSVDTTIIGDISTSTLILKLNADVDAANFSITYGSHGNVFTTETLKTSESFNYLTLLITSLSDVTLNLFSNDGTQTYTARFDTETQSIVEAEQ